MSELPLSPSPGASDHVSIALVNSRIHLPGGKCVDALDTPEATTRWLIDHDLVGEGAQLQSYCQNRLTGLRSELREVFTAQVTGDQVKPGVLQGINAALTAAPNASLLGHSAETGFFRSTEHPATQLVEHAMSIIAEDAVALLTNENASPLSLCEAQPCTRFFLRTHARRQWCCTRCGDRIRAARSYARRRSPAGNSAT